MSERPATLSKAYAAKVSFDRVNSLYRALLGDPAFVFGSKASKVSDPGLAQLVDIGFFTLRGAPKVSKEKAFGLNFVRSMAKHGFTHGATYGSPDYMHFELSGKD